MHALEKEMATPFSILAWRIPGTEEPGGLLFLGLHGVGHDWSDLAAVAAAEEEKKKMYEDIFEEIIVENLPNVEKVISPRGTKSPIQDKPKEKHAKTHTNQTNKD